jgi:FAD/FMN-containing dehydrogenase
MSKIGHYLQEHLVGEVVASAEARRYFSTDGSIFSVTPTLIVYPRSENDVRKTARFTWQLAERGRIIPITARGSGTDLSGAAIGTGIVMVFPAHMNKIIEFDSKDGHVVVDPGINFGKLQQTLLTHGRFLPSYPSSLEFSTVGGAVANNGGGEKSFKYGTTGAFVKKLRVVLANGEVIETGRLNKRELNKKLGLATFEGEVYRAVDTLIEEQHNIIDQLSLNITKNSAGYNLGSVKTKSGFDLTPLFIGSQGTLGIITEINLITELHNPSTSLLVGMFDDIARAQLAISELRAAAYAPSFIEMIDENLLNIVDQINPNLLKGIITKPFPKVILFVEFDNPQERVRKRMAKRAVKILQKHGVSHKLAGDQNQQSQLLKLRQAVSTVMLHSDGNIRAVPVIEDGIVPVEEYTAFLTGIYDILKRNQVTAAVWGHAGDANLHMQPFLDLSQVGDRQKIFRLLEEYNALLIKLGGSTNGEHGEGRLQGPFLSKIYDKECYELLQKVKTIFDPYGTLNPGVKINVTLDDIKPLLRHEYSLGSLHDFLPRT